MSDIDELMKAYGEAGGDRAILENNEIAHLVANGHNLLSMKSVAGVVVDAKETLTGISATVTLKEGIKTVSDYARVSPMDKLKIVKAWKHRGEVVVMTGDGVNDAPALKKADIGVAMGITGTEVSKGAAVMILTDDNFATIVKAVEYGRAIYGNLAKYIRFQMGMLAAFIITYLGAAFFSILGGVPFSALVVLFINFLIQVPIAIALGFDKPSPGLMERKPRPLSQPVLSGSQWERLVFMGLLVAIGTLAVEAAFKSDAALSATMGMVIFALFNVAFGLSARSETGTVFVLDTVGDRRQLQLYGLALILLSVVLMNITRKSLHEGLGFFLGVEGLADWLLVFVANLDVPLARG